jgi:3-methyladenine DNA glycosylase AlkD
MTQAKTGQRAKPKPGQASPAKRAKAKPALKKASAPAKATKRASASKTLPKSSGASAVKAQVQTALAWLEQQGSRRIVADMAPRYGIHTKKAFGVSVGSLRKYAKRLGPSHELAAALWASGWYEARMLAAFVDEPTRVTPAQMDAWCRDFDNWAICDTACFHLFDRTPHAFGKVKVWAKQREEFVKRAAFALLASMALHGSGADDGSLARSLSLVEAAANDERNFVKKAVNWALRAVGRRSAELNAEAVLVARRLAASAEPAPRWIGKDALRELTSAAVLTRFSTEKTARKA